VDLCLSPNINPFLWLLVYDVRGRLPPQLLWSLYLPWPEEKSPVRRWLQTSEIVLHGRAAHSALAGQSMRHFLEDSGCLGQLCAGAQGPRPDVTFWFSTLGSGWGHKCPANSLPANLCLGLFPRKSQSKISLFPFSNEICRSWVFMETQKGKVRRNCLRNAR
jgi:hypothetical protein